MCSRSLRPTKAAPGSSPRIAEKISTASGTAPKTYIVIGAPLTELPSATTRDSPADVGAAGSRAVGAGSVKRGVLAHPAPHSSDARRADRLRSWKDHPHAS